jgi:NitT/TauT family transport system substrate-binding protein
VTGIEAEVNYLFHGPLGLQTRDFTWKPAYRQAVATAIDTLRLMKRTETDLDVKTFIDDQYIRAAFKQSGLDYEARLKNNARLPLVAKDAAPESAFAALRTLQQTGKKVRVVFVHDRNSGLKLLANDAWFVTGGKEITAFLGRDAAQAWATKNGGKVVDFKTVQAG